MKRVILFLSFLFTFASVLQAQILLPNIPDVTGGLIQAFEFDSTTNKLYIVGDFTQVGSTPRTGFAVIDITTGAVLNDFDPLIITRSAINNTNPVHAVMHIYKNKLYIGGVYSATASGGFPANYIFALDLISGSVINLYANAGVSDFKIYNDKIYVTGGFENYNPDEYMVSELDTLGNILWQKSISSNPGDRLHCVEVKNNNLFAGGNFSTFNGAACNNIVKIDLSTHLTTPWTLSPLPGPVLTPTCFGISNLIAYNNDILIDLYNPSCASPHNLGFYDVATGSFLNQKTTLPYQADYPYAISENDTSFWYFNNSGLQLYGVKNYVSSWSPNAGGQYVAPFFRKSNYLFVGGNFTTLEGAPHSGLGIYCLSPDKPIIQTTSAAVCRQQNNVNYSVIPNPWAGSYVWTYTGTGATINGNGPSVNLDFSSTATSGSLNVFVVSDCGTTGPTLSIPIIVNPLPPTNAGPDINFNCIHTSDSLNATPNNLSMHCTWTGPSSFSSTSFNNQVLKSTVTGGDYILTVIINATGCQKSDTAKIIFDTLIPTINHLAGNFSLTCATTSLTLNAAGNYPPNDTLHWSGTSFFSQNNPATISNVGTYILSVTSGVNGCKNKDSVVVTQNNVVPNLSLPVTQDTITCLRDSIQLLSVSTNSSAILYWKHTTLDSLLNNSYINQPGIYTAHAIDTTNGCTSQAVFTASQFTTPPIVNITPGNYQLNCSYDTVILSGNSSNAGASLMWTGPGSFSSLNPATIVLQGIYFLTATHPQNGCTAKDSITVLKQNSLSLNLYGNTTICNGSSTTLSVSAIGGTPGFTYSWNNSAGNSSHVSVNPTDTTTYVATLTDSAGCVGKDSIKVNVPMIFSDSISTFIPCDPNHPNGQIQVFSKGGVLPYTYSLNTGMYQPLNVFSNLAFGTYTVSLRDGLGCALKSFATIDSTSLRPSADFILSTNEIKGDTFVLVDISNPRPDSVSWVLPVGSQLLNSNLYAPEIINSDTGSMQITMLAWFGDCQMSLTKNIHVFKNDTLHATAYNGNGIKDITIYPNTGNFTIDVSLYKIQTFAVFIFDALGNELMRLPYTDLDFISVPINIVNATPGTYLLKVIAEYDSQTKTFLITQ
jgi:hypothetical protein